MGTILPLASGDRKFFVSEAAYLNYLKLEDELSKQPLGITFDWRLLIEALLGGLT
jgi:hypothetical protein